MGGRNSAIRNQEAYMEKKLKDIQFNIEEDEVQFIQNGIETLVTDIIDHICDNLKSKIEKLKQEWVNDLVRESCVLKEQNTSDRLIKVGSFYDGTKNHFPDEFDYIFVIGTYHTTDRCALKHFLPGYYQYIACRLELLNIFTHIEFPRQYIYKPDGSSCSIHFHGLIRETGPAQKVQFLYTNQSGHETAINVDIVPAFNIIDSFLTEDILNDRRTCSIPDFNRFIAGTGSYVIVNGGMVSFTKTEKRFIKEHLSPYHREVYRLVKHLINGKDKNETFKEYCKSERIRNLDISSFSIKTTMIFHHFKCTYDTKGDQRKYHHVCAGEIVLDLQQNLADCHRRHILFGVEKRNNFLYKNDTNRPERNRTEEQPEHRDFRSFGSRYLFVLGKSLNPEPRTDWWYMFKDVDKSYSQYMLENRQKFLGEDEPYFKLDGYHQ